MNKLKIFKQESLVIKDRIIQSRDSFIQMDNITRVWFGRTEVNIPVFKIITAFIFGISLQTISKLSTIGILIIVGSIITLIYYYILWKHHTLSFELTSGKIYAFTTLDNEFLKISYEKVKEIMNNEKDNKSYEINFDSCKINVIPQNSGTIIINDVNNSSNIDINNSINNNVNINYEIINKELSELLKISEETLEQLDKEIIENAKTLAKNKDERGLKECLKKLSNKTLKIIEVSSSFITLADFISRFM